MFKMEREYDEQGNLLSITFHWEPKLVDWLIVFAFGAIFGLMFTQGWMLK